MDTKEINEVLDAVDATSDAIAAAKADGTIDWRDLPKLGAPVLKWKDALNGFDKIPAELKDLDAAETQQLLVRAIESVRKLGEALLTPTKP